MPAPTSITSGQEGAFTSDIRKTINANFTGVWSQIANATPASASAAGTAGQICYDTSFLYVCVATNTWLKVAIATW